MELLAFSTKWVLRPSVTGQRWSLRVGKTFPQILHTSPGYQSPEQSQGLHWFWHAPASVEAWACRPRNPTVSACLEPVRGSLHPPPTARQLLDPLMRDAIGQSPPGVPASPVQWLLLFEWGDCSNRHLFLARVCSKFHPGRGFASQNAIYRGLPCSYYPACRPRNHSGWKSCFCGVAPSSWAAVGYPKGLCQAEIAKNLPLESGHWEVLVLLFGTGQAAHFPYSIPPIQWIELGVSLFSPSLGYGIRLVWEGYLGRSPVAGEPSEPVSNLTF